MFRRKRAAAGDEPAAPSETVPEPEGSEGRPGEPTQPSPSPAVPGEQPGETAADGSADAAPADAGPADAAPGTSAPVDTATADALDVDGAASPRPEPSDDEPEAVATLAASAAAVAAVVESGGSTASAPAVPAAAITGTARFARAGDAAGKALREGDIAVVDLPDLDRVQAEALVARRVRAVLNASDSSTGRFPNLGPQVLADAGVTLVDRVGPGIWTRVRNGETIRVDGGKIFRGDVLVAQGQRVDDAAVTERLGLAERDLATRLSSLTANASDHLERERAMLLEGARVPRLAPALRERPVVVVSKSYGWEDDLKRVRRWIRDSGAVVVAVTDAADALLSKRIKPDVVIGHLDDLSDRALRSGADVVVVTSSGKVSGHERFERAGVDVTTFVAAGSAGDLAVVLADTNDAEVIVEVGAPRGLVEFLERGPADVASAFVTRLRAGAKLVDAQAVGYFTGRGLPAWPVVLVLLAGIVAVVAAIGVTPTGADWYEHVGDALSDIRSWFEGLL